VAGELFRDAAKLEERLYGATVTT